MVKVPVVMLGDMKELNIKPPLPDPLKTPPFFSQWAELQNIFANASGTEKTPRARRPRK